jgi:hypothetical protein
VKRLHVPTASAPSSGETESVWSQATAWPAHMQAARDDLFVPSPNFTPEQNARIKGPGSTLCVVRICALCPMLRAFSEGDGVEEN